MIFFTYKEPLPSSVKFQRIIMGWLAIAALFIQDINIVRAFFVLSAIGLITGTRYSPSTLFLKIVKKLFKISLVNISNHHIRYYQINSSMDFIDHFLRLIASSATLILLYLHQDTAAWMLMAFLSVFMMLSAYFGFCLSALVYIALLKLGRVQGTLCKQDEPGETKLNQNCTLARHCFTPYKRCDSCHVGITNCLGTKFNILVLVIGLVMSLFLFFENAYFVQANILIVMGLIFWLGYQINYNTDDLAESNNANVALNTKLRAYNLTLEEEVQKRTSEIAHLVNHDQLTDLYNRYWFENRSEVAIEEVKKESNHYVLAFLDLDHFKAVNDTAGHLAGDELLRKVSALMLSLTDKKDVVARLGGDEFGILCEGKSMDETIISMQKICDAIADFEFKWQEHSFHIGVSIGLVATSKETTDLYELFHQADMACYEAKDAGRNQVVQYRNNNKRSRKIR